MTMVGSSSSWPRAAAVGLILLAVYWLTASGAFHSVDEHAVFSAAHNLALHGRVDQSALYWNAGDPDPASIGLDGEFYSKYGIGHSLVAALGILLGRAIPGAGLASTTMLINGLATALTGALLVLAASRLGYTPSAGAVLALCYGLATFAWLYARTMFGEPLVALGWLAAVWVLLIRQDAKHALIAGILVALTVTARPALTVVTPCFALLFSSVPSAPV